MRRWLGCGLLCYALGGFVELMLSAPGLSAVFYVPGVLSVPINVVIGAMWIGLKAPEPLWGGRRADQGTNDEAANDEGANERPFLAEGPGFWCRAGLEPARLAAGILSPLRLPVSPPGRWLSAPRWCHAEPGIMPDFAWTHNRSRGRA